MRDVLRGELPRLRCGRLTHAYNGHGRNRAIHIFPSDPPVSAGALNARSIDAVL